MGRHQDSLDVSLEIPLGTFADARHTVLCVAVQHLWALIHASLRAGKDVRVYVD
jgi:hypothetical protein